MPQKKKSLLYLSCFVIVAVLHYCTDTSSLQDDEIVKTQNAYIDKLSTLSFDDNKVHAK